MTTLPIDPAAIADLIRTTARAVILPRFRALAPDQVREKGPGDLVTVADEEAERMLTELLTRTLPGSVVVGEEAVAKDATVLDRLRGPAPVWVIDPVDGTRNFVAGKPEFTVLVALVIDDQPVAGWIHHPISGAVIDATRGGGAWDSDGGRRLAIDPAAGGAGLLTGACYGPAPSGKADLGKLLLKAGAIAGLKRSLCAGMDYLRLARGEIQFMMSSISYPWDHAAGILIAREAGAVGGFLDSPGEEPVYRPARTDARVLTAPTPAAWQALRTQALAL